MNYLHYKMNAGPENTILVSCNEKANVRLLDTLNYYKFCAGKCFDASSEYLDVSTIKIKVPRKSQWHVVIEHGEYKGEIRALVDIL